MNEINIISSDARYDALNEIFIKNGYRSKICTPKEVEYPKILILPIKSTLADEEFSQIFQNVEKSALVFSPKSEIIKKYFSGRVIDYSKSEVFIDKNAYITAECAIQITLSTLKKTVFNSRCAIIGYGRIGKHLSKILTSLNAEVSVFARREESRNEAKSNGCEAKTINEIINGFYDVIFNTVPSKIISKEISDKISPKTLVIDLASLPGGFEDENYPKRALGLPGKIMPISAAEAIYDFVNEYISSERKNI